MILKDIREKLGKTQQEVAEKMEVTKQQVSLIEADDIPDRRETLEKYLKAIGVSFDDYIRILEEYQRRRLNK